MLRPSRSYHPDPELFQKFIEGNEAAFSAVYRHYYFQVYQFAKRWLSEPKDAEDITADTFVKLWDRRESLDNFDNLGGFLYLTVRNACFDLLRRRQLRTIKEEEVLRRFQDDMETDFTIQQVREEFFRIIYARVESMPPKMKEIFLLSYRDGLKPAEIARQLNLSVHTVGNHKANAIRFLRQALTDRPILIAFLMFFDRLPSHY
jgi:RNA polymerase sigma-70 factor (ECF subfamily)